MAQGRPWSGLQRSPTGACLGVLRGTNRPTKRAFRAGHTGFDQDRHFRDERGPLPAQLCAELVPEPSTAHRPQRRAKKAGGLPFRGYARCPWQVRSKPPIDSDSNDC